MGAHSVTTTLVGKDLGSAFTAAQREAEIEHGTDPYNGTISTASGVSEFKDVSWGRMQARDLFNAAWAITDIFEEGIQVAELRAVNRILRKHRIPKRLANTAVLMARQLEESKRGTWIAAQVPPRMRAYILKRTGNTGRRGMKVWIVSGFAAS